MKLRYQTLNVFTRTRFTGNPLAVVHDKVGLPQNLMQSIAREFTYPETVFIQDVRPEAGRAALRIFTPTKEIPFAGHPTIGTALHLKQELLAGRQNIVLEEGAGDVAVRFESTADGEEATFTAPGSFELGGEIDPGGPLTALGLEQSDLAPTEGLPRLAGFGGMTFMFMQVATLESLQRARVPHALGTEQADKLYLFCHEREDEVRARMFAPDLGVPEDPATGSAAAAFAGLMASFAPDDEERTWRIVQGVEMGRASRIRATASKAGGRVRDVLVSGTAITVMSGELEID